MIHSLIMLIMYIACYNDAALENGVKDIFFDIHAYT